MVENNSEKNVPFFPDHLMYEAKVALWFGIGLIIVGIIGLFDPMGLGDPANPLVTPEHTTPEWYFLWLFQLLKYIPARVLGTEGRIIGALIPILLVGVLVIWPFLNKKPDKSRKQTRNRAIFSTIVIIIIIILTILGEIT